MVRKFIRRYLPSHESVRDHRLIRRFGALLHHPNLWHLNRRSVSGGVAVGLFAGLIPGPFQMLAAALLAIPLRVNLPVALATTLYTNPFTIVPLYLVAYGIGRRVLGDGGNTPTPPPDFSFSEIGHWITGLVDWTLTLGKPLALGLVLLALGLAIAGYIAVRVAWRIYVTIAWRRRHAHARAKR